MSDFPWAYIDTHSSLSASGPTGSIQFRAGDTGTYSNLTGSDNFMFHTASGVLAISGTVEVVGTASANQLNVLSQSVVTTNFSASGDTVFGNTTDDIHQFTGSVNIGGALSASSELFAAGLGEKLAVRLSGPITATGSIKAAMKQTVPPGFVSSSGEVYGTSLRVSGKTDGTTGLSVSGSITGSSFISSSGEIFSAGGLRNSGTGDSNFVFSGTLNNKSFISSSGETFAVGGLRASGTLAPDASGNSFGLHVSGSTDFKHSKAATDYTSISGTFEITGAADSLVVLNTQDTDALREIAFKKAGTTQTSIGIDSDEHFIIENESTKDLIIRTQNQNTIRIFGNQQAVEINGSGVTANATLDVNGSTNITSSLTVSGTVAFGDRRRADASDTLGGGVLSVLGGLTASKGIHFGEAAAEPILIPLDKKILFTGSAVNASASFMSSSSRHFSISGSNIGGMTLSGSRIGLVHEDAGFANGFNESGIVVTGTLAGPGSTLGLDSTNKVILTPATPGGINTSVIFNKSNVHSGSANLKMNFENNTVAQTGKFEIKSGSSPASAPVVFEVDGDDGTIAGRARGKFYHVYSLNFGLTSPSQARTGRFLPLTPGGEGTTGTGAGSSPYYDGSLTNSRSILNPSSGRVIMLMYRFDTDAGQYDPTQALANPPLFFMRVGSILGNGVAGNSFGTETPGSVIHSVTASSHPGPDTVGGIDFRTGVGALTGFANITGSWSFGTGSMMNLHIRTLNGQNSPGNAYLTLVCEYDHLDEYVSGSGN